MFISPLKCVPLSNVFSIPPNSISKIAYFISSCPKIEGAIDDEIIFRTSGFYEMILISFKSDGLIEGDYSSVDIENKFKQTRLHLNTP